MVVSAELKEELYGAASKETVRSTTAEMGLGLNILTLMFTGFVVFYYIGTMISDSPSNTVLPVMMGLVGVIGALLMEVILVLLRERRQDILKEKADKEIEQKRKAKLAQWRVQEKRKKMREQLKEMERDAAGAAQPQSEAADSG